MGGRLVFAIMLCCGVGIANAAPPSSRVATIQAFDAGDWIKGLADRDECRSAGQTFVGSFMQNRAQLIELIEFEETHPTPALMRDEAGKSEFARLYTKNKPAISSLYSTAVAVNRCMPPPKTTADVDWQKKLSGLQSSCATALTAYESSRALLRLP